MHEEPVVGRCPQTGCMQTMYKKKLLTQSSQLSGDFDTRSSSGKGMLIDIHGIDPLLDDLKGREEDGIDDARSTHGDAETWES